MRAKARAVPGRVSAQSPIFLIKTRSTMWSTTPIMHTAKASIGRITISMGSVSGISEKNSEKQIIEATNPPAIE